MDYCYLGNSSGSACFDSGRPNTSLWDVGDKKRKYVWLLFEKLFSLRPCLSRYLETTKTWYCPNSQSKLVQNPCHNGSSLPIARERSLPIAREREGNSEISNNGNLVYQSIEHSRVIFRWHKQTRGLFLYYYYICFTNVQIFAPNSDLCEVRGGGRGPDAGAEAADQVGQEEDLWWVREAGEEGASYEERTVEEIGSPPSSLSTVTPPASWRTTAPTAPQAHQPAQLLLVQVQHVLPLHQQHHLHHGDALHQADQIKK